MFKSWTDPQSAVLTAIRREQERSVRRVNLIRLGGASGLLLLYVVLDLGLRQAEWGGGAVPMVAGYWLAAGGLVLLGRRLKLLAFVAGLAGEARGRWPAAALLVEVAGRQVRARQAYRWLAAQAGVSPVALNYALFGRTGPWDGRSEDLPGSA